MRRILIDHEQDRGEGTGTLIDMLQNAGLNQVSQRIHITTPDGEDGEILLMRGRIRAIHAGDDTDAEALKKIMGWQIREISVRGYEAAEDGEDTENFPVDRLLLEIADSIPALSTPQNNIIKTKEDNTMTTIEERISLVLENLVERLGGIDAALLVDSEGFVISSYGANIGSSTDVEMIGGIATSLVTMTSRVAAVLKTGAVDRVMLHASQRHVFISPAGNGTNLVTIAKRDASLGLIFAELNKVATAIQNSMGEN